MTTLPTDLWRRVKSFSAEALELDPCERDAYIIQACAGDAKLEAEVRSLVASAVAATPYFEQPAGLTIAWYPGGPRIGPYVIAREIGSGGMGNVYLAERDDGEFQQRVAIKIVRGGFASQLLLERFREERRILASLEHPNIARLLDGGTTDTGLPYVVMEYIQGEPIDQFCTGRALTLRGRLELFQQVCGAVQCAHQHLVIHRDIKPGNILVTPDGTPKLLDFGIAKLLDPESGLEQSPLTTLRVMTPENASPEQLSGRPVSVAGDVYALGVLLYRLLTGRSPYGATPLQGPELIRAVCEQVPAAPSTITPLPADIDMIVMKAIRKEPDRRYGSAGQLSEDIKRFLDGRPVLASPDSLRYRTGKFVTRHRTAVVGAITLALAIAAGAAATVWQARAAERERSRAQREFDAVRGLAQSMMGELHDAVAQLPGSTVAREILLRRGTQYLDALAAEAAGDDALRREVAMGYLRLSVVQGTSGAATLGDAASATKSLKQALALLQPLVRRPHPAPEDRVRLATVLANLSQLQPVSDKKAPLDEARALLDSLTPAEASTSYALAARALVWYEIGGIQDAAHDYAGAELSFQHLAETAEAQLHAAPRRLDASYNLSLAYKYRGAALEMLGRRAEAIQLYRNALDLDRQRVAAEPGQARWRLDLSFSEGSIAAALLAEGDLNGARQGYERAVDIRESVVREDPNDDFAGAALARGYDRLGGVYEELGRIGAALDYRNKALQTNRKRLEGHPDRDYLWHQYVDAAFADVTACTAALQRTTRADRRQLATWATTTLDDLQTLQARWAKGTHTGALLPAPDIVQAQRALIARAR